MTSPTPPDSNDKFPVVQKLRELKEKLLEETEATCRIRDEFDGSRYTLGKQLHEGTLSNVFLAHDKVLNREVVIKFYSIDDAANCDQIIREGQRLASIQSPFVCTCFDLGWSAEQPFLVLESISGPLLSRKIASRMTGDWLSLSLMMIDLCRGVEDMHAADLVHWDLKPSNILVGQDGRPKIVDLGLSLLRSEVDLQSTLLQGSPSYLAPEIARGESVDGLLVDVFGVGAVLYEALTRQPPFQRNTKMETLEASFRAEVVAPRELDAAIPKRLEAICLRCLAEEPGQRYPSVRAIRNDLEAFSRSVRVKRKRAALWAVIGIFIGIMLVISLNPWFGADRNTADNDQTNTTREDDSFQQNGEGGTTKKPRKNRSIPGRYDSTRISFDDLFEALDSGTEKELNLRNDFEVGITFVQNGQETHPQKLVADVPFEIRLTAEIDCFVSVHRHEFAEDGEFLAALSEFPPYPVWCVALGPDNPRAFTSEATSATRGPSSYFVLAGEFEWKKKGEVPYGRFDFDANHRGMASKQKICERLVSFSINSRDKRDTDEQQN